MKRRLVVSSGLVLSLALAAPARSEPGDAEQAERLFQEAKALMAKDRYEEACPKLAESQRVDPATGTLLALALCHENQGRIASAWREFKQALPAAQSEGRRDRETMVVTHMVALAPRLPKLVISVAPEDLEDASFVVKLDGEPLERGSLNVPYAVDPGEHVVEASANGKVSYRGSVTVRQERETRALNLPALDSATSGSSNGLQIKPHQTGMIIAGAGAAALVVGTIFGIRAIGKSDDAKALCDPANCSNPEAYVLNDQAKSAATVSTVAIVLGVAAIAAGGALWYTNRPRAKAGSAPSSFGPSLGQSALLRF